MLATGRWPLVTAVLLAGPLAACSFEPMYGAHSSEKTMRAGEITAGIAVEASAEDFTKKALAYRFRTDLEDRLNPEGAKIQPQYRLKALIRYVEVPVAISRDGTVSHYNVILRANLTLSRAVDGAVVYTGTAQRTGSYNNPTNAFYSTYVSSQDTVRRTVTGLAEDVQLRLAAFFTQNPNPQPLASIPEPEPVPPINIPVP